MPISPPNHKFEYAQEDIDGYFVTAWDLAESFIEGIYSDSERDLGNIEIYIDTRRLFLAIDSTYQDIARYKNYHQEDPWEERLDCTKRCGYFMKWIPKFKPIVVRLHKRDASEDPVSANASLEPMEEDVFNDEMENQETDELQVLNEMFVIYLFELHLSDEIEDDIVLSEKKIKEWAYDLLYRNISRDGWINILQTIKECCTPEIIEKVPFLEKL